MEFIHGLTRVLGMILEVTVIQVGEVTHHETQILNRVQLINMEQVVEIKPLTVRNDTIRYWKKGGYEPVTEETGQVYKTKFFGEQPEIICSDQVLIKLSDRRTNYIVKGSYEEFKKYLVN